MDHRASIHVDIVVETDIFTPVGNFFSIPSVTIETKMRFIENISYCGVSRVLAFIYVYDVS